MTLFLAIGAVAIRPAVDRAQTATTVPLPASVRATRFAVSTPARDLPALPKPEIGPDQDRPRTRIIPNREIGKEGFTPDLDNALQQFVPTPQVMPPPILSFDGVSNQDNFNSFGFRLSPPDTNGDVGPNHYVQQVNLLVRVFTKAGAPVTPPFRLSTLFAPLGGICASNDNGDPVALYDPLADRWLLSQFAFFGLSSPPYHQCIAISQTADPAGAYFLYDFTTPGSEFPDYPKLGVWPDAYYMTDVQFFLGGSFDGTGAFAFERAKMLTGDPTASLIYFNLDLASHPEGIGGLLPADLDGVTPAPAGTPNPMAYFIANEFGDPIDGLRIFDFHADFANPANSTFLERVGSPLPVAAFNPVSPAGRQDIPQPPPATSSNNVDSLSDRLMHRLQYRNRGGGVESLVVDHTVNVVASPAFRAGIRYYELHKTPGNTPYTVFEQATFSPDTNHRWMGSAAVDYQGNLAVGYSVSSTTVFPSIRYAGRLTSDPPGGLFQGEATMIAGSGVQLSTSSRWGDYSMLGVDPTDDCTFWYTTEYYTAASQLTSPVGWLTRIGSFKYPVCTARPVGTLNVNVTRCDNGNPVNGAQVELNGNLHGTTNAAGVFSSKLAPGAYAITVKKAGLGNGSGNANIVAGATTSVDICLEPPTDVDLTVSALTAPKKAAAGGAVTVGYTIHNGGGGAADPTVTGFYLSTDQTFDGGDVPIGSDPTPGVPGGGSVSDSGTATIPANTTGGVYYLIVRADSTNVESETNESNNTRSKKILVGPDLKISALSVSPTTVSAGGSVTIKETTKNVGAESTGGGSTTRYLLSIDKIAGPGDDILGSHAVPVLGPGGTSSLTLAVTIPAGKPPRQYYVLAVADDGHVIAESKENNNTRSVLITVN